MKHLELIQDDDGELWVEYQGRWLCVTDEWLLGKIAAKTHQEWTPAQVDKQYGPACRVRLVRGNDVVCADCRRQDHDACKGGTWCDCQHEEPRNWPQPAVGQK